MVLAKKKAVGAEYYQYGPLENNQSVSQPQSKTRKSFKLNKAISSIVVVFVLGLLITYQHAQVANLGNRVNHLKNQIEKAENENQQLIYRIAALSSLTRIENLALTELNMLYPENIHYIMASKNTDKIIALDVDMTAPGGEEKVDQGNQWTTAVAQFFYNGFSDSAR